MGIKYILYCTQKKSKPKEIEIPYIQTKEQLADVFTKEMVQKQFDNITNKLELYNIYIASLIESVKIIEGIE